MDRGALGRGALAAAAAAVLLCACGDDQPEPRGAFGTAAALTNVELTDAMMEDYVAALKRYRASGAARGRPGDAFFGGSTAEATRFALTAAVVARAQLATQKPVVADAYDRMIAEMEEKLPTLSGEARTKAETSLARLKEARSKTADAFAELPGTTEQDVRNAEVVKRWRAKLDEVHAD